MTALSDSTHSRVSVGSRSWFRISSIWSMDAPLARDARSWVLGKPAGVAGKPFNDTAKFAHTRRYGGFGSHRPRLARADLRLDAGDRRHIHHPAHGRLRCQDVGRLRNA